MRKSATTIKTVKKNWLLGSEAIPVTWGKCPALGCLASSVLALKTSVNLVLTLYFNPSFPILILLASLIISFLIYYLHLSKEQYFEGAELCSMVHLLYSTLTHPFSTLDQGSLVRPRQKRKKIASAEEVTNFLWSKFKFWVGMKGFELSLSCPSSTETCRFAQFSPIFFSHRQT